MDDDELEEEEAKIEAERRDGYLFYGNLNRELDVDSEVESRLREEIEHSDDESILLVFISCSFQISTAGSFELFQRRWICCL